MNKIRAQPFIFDERGSVLQTEQQLLQSFSEGDEAAIEILVARYEDRLYNLCFKLTARRHEADDLYQQTWLKVLQKERTYAHKSFQNWLYTICLNTYRDTYRQNTRRSQLIADNVDDMTENAAGSGSAETEVMDSITQAMLMAKINLLPDKFRLPILLYYFDELDYNESARVLGLPVGTLKSRLNTAKKKLRLEMENETDV